MTDLNAILTLEGSDTIDEETAVACFQQLINSGTVWSLQGWYGRAASTLLAHGLVTLPNQS